MVRGGATGNPEGDAEENPMSLFSSTVLTASRRPTVRRLVTGSPATRGLVDRFVAGETTEAALSAVRALTADGRLATLDHLGEDVTDPAQAAANVRAYLDLLAGLGGLPAEVSVKLSALGPHPYDAAAEICGAAQRAGTTVTVDMEDSSTVDDTLAVVEKLRVDFPWVGAVLQSALHRTEADCRALAGTRVRLVKGAYAEPASVAHQHASEVTAAYERCLDVLMAGSGHPMIGTHDPRLIERALGYGRAADSYEFQMLYGVRVDEQRRLAAAGHRMRVYVPYGADWYGYFSRRLAERPANLGFLLRSLLKG
jgi:proline dehydrogenase